MSRPADLNSLLANVDAPAATFRQQRFDAGGPVARRAGGDTAEVLLGPAGETVKIGRRSLRAMRLCRDAADQQVLDAVTIENLDQTLDVRLAWLRQIWLPSSRVTNRAGGDVSLDVGDPREHRFLRVETPTIEGDRHVVVSSRRRTLQARLELLEGDW